MPHTKPTTKIDVIGDLDLRPEEAYAEYRISKAQNKYFIKKPNWDSAGDSIDLLYTANIREYNAILKLQNDLLNETKNRNVINMQRIEEMSKTQKNLQERFIAVNDFMKNCSDKKRYAEKQIVDERALQKRLGNEIEDYNKSIEELTKFHQALTEITEELKPYERVLEDVVKKSDLFESPKDCMARCDALMYAQSQIHKLEQEKLNDIDNMRTRMVKMATEGAFVILGLQNELNKLEHIYVQTRAEVLKYEKILANVKDTIADAELSKERTLMAILILYKLLCKRRSINPTYSKFQVDQIMDFIYYEYEVLCAIEKELESQQKCKEN